MPSRPPVECKDCGRRYTDRPPGAMCSYCLGQLVKRTHCGCGHPVARCAPERCSHRFAHNALGLGDES